MTVAFPAYLQGDAKGASPTSVMLDSEAACFQHPDKRAVVACSSCGRFLCALCRIDLKGQPTCVACIQAAQHKGRATDLSRHRLLYDDIALALALLPILFWPVTILTAPAALVLCFVWWRRPASLVPRSRVRFVLAALFALLEIAGWAAGITLGMRS
jgi:hypothetical protein